MRRRVLSIWPAGARPKITVAPAEIRFHPGRDAEYDPKRLEAMVAELEELIPVTVNTLRCKFRAGATIGTFKYANGDVYCRYPVGALYPGVEREGDLP